jgi:hypothetical protein
LERFPLNQEYNRLNLADTIFVSSLVSQKFPKGGGLNAFKNFRREQGSSAFGNIPARGLAPICTLRDFLKICTAFGTV